MERLLKRLLISLAAVLFFAGSVLAAPLCTDLSPTLLECSINYSIDFEYFTSFNTVVNLPQFNPAKGTLTRIDYLIEITDMDASVYIKNTDVFDSTYNVSIGRTVTISDVAQGNLLLAQTIPLITDTKFIPSGETTLFSGSNATSNSNQPCPPGFVCPPNLPISYVSPFAANIAAIYIGSGDVSFRLRGILAQSVSGGEFAANDVTTHTAGTASILYTYVSEVPEPATMLLIGSSLLLVGFSRKAKALSA